MNIPLVVKLIVSVFFLSIIPIQVYALTPGQVFDKVKDAVVVVKALDTQGKPKAQGSGVLLPSGKVATNCHVVEGGASYQVGRGEQLVPATLFAEDDDKDICILDAKGITGKPVQFGKAVNLKVGDPVYAVGAPKGLELSLSDGIVAQLRGGPPPFIQTTTAISPGSSGGGLFDGEGRLVGLTTLYLEGGQSLNFAMPVEWIDEIKPGRKPIAEGHSHTEWVKRASVLNKMKDWEGMFDWCLKWTKSEPKNSFAWWSLGWSYDHFNRYDEAVDAYRQAVRIDPEYAQAWFYLGLVYMRLNRYDEEIEAYRQALRIEPKNADAWCFLGMAYSKLNRYDEAIEAYRQALRINPEHAQAWNVLGVAFFNLKRYDDAIDAYRQGLRINPKAAHIWLVLGDACRKLNRYDEAIGAYRQVLRINPEAVNAWDGLGYTYIELKRYDEAVEAWRQALRIDPEHARAWDGLGTTYALSGNRSAALEAVRELRRLDPESADKLFNLIGPR